MTGGALARRPTVAAWVERKECSIETAAHAQRWRTDEAQGGSARCSRSPDPHRSLGRVGRWNMGERRGKGKLLEQTREQVLMCSL